MMKQNYNTILSCHMETVKQPDDMLSLNTWNHGMMLLMK